MEFKKILVPTDFSICSKQGLGFAVSLAEKYGSEIFILHVLDTKLIEQSSYFDLNKEDKIKEKIWTKTKQNLEEFLRDQDFGEIQVHRMVIQGAPFQEIVKKAKEIGADLIILGSRGGTVDLDRLFFGSTAEKVVRLLPCPVLCVPPMEL